MANLGSRMMRFVKGKMMRHLPQMMTCVEFEDFVLDFLDDQLTAKQRHRFELHLRLCRECREYLDAYQRARDLGRKALTDTDPELPEIPEDLVTAIMDAQERK